jgi:hypothetical protein
MPSLLKDLAEKFRGSLNRHSINSASRWACEYRVMGGKDFAGPWRFDHHPWLKDMHDSEAPYNVGQKAAQLGYTEAMLNISLFHLDVNNRDVLYILPNKSPVAADFSMSRVDKAIELSPHLKKMFAGGTSNVGLKQAGSSSFFIRGANSKSSLKSVPTGIIIFDEFDEMDQTNINLAEERASGQKFTLDWKISTPTTPGTGINELYEDSTKDNYYFRCPHCSKFIKLSFPENLVITAEQPNDPNITKTHLICGECKGVLQHELKHEFFKTAQWVSEQPGKLTRGFYVNQLYSPALLPWKIAKLYLISLRDQLAELEFMNSKMGLPHIVQGAQINDEMIKELIREYGMLDSCRSTYVVTMGVDVGKVLHVEICLWDLSECSPIDLNTAAKPKVIWAGEVKHFSQLDQLMIAFNVKSCVIDIMPETREAEAFAKRFYGRVRCCRYNPHVAARSVSLGSDMDKQDLYVMVNRTSWLDMSLGRFRNRTIELPQNIPQDYLDQIKVPVRRPSKDKDGNVVFKYETPGNKADHYAHARNYSEIALPFAVGNKIYMNTEVGV